VRVDAIAAPRLSVVKSSPTKLLTAPQTVSYSYLVTNVGNVTVHGIALSDNNDNDDLSCPQTTLAPTVSMTCTATHTFTQGELDANGSPAAGSGFLHNNVTAHSNEAPDALGELDIPIEQNPVMTIVKSSTTVSLSGPQTVTYDYLVTNAGNVTLTGINLDDNNAGPVSCPSTSLGVGLSMTCHATHSFTQAELDANGSPIAATGFLHNNVLGHSKEAPDAPGSLDIPIVQTAGMTVTKSSATTSLSASQTVTYDYEVKNTGNVTLTGINLVDDNAGAVTCPSTSVAVGASITCHATHSFTQAELDANGSPTAGSGVLHNNVTAHSNETPDATGSLDIPIVQSPALAVAKTSATTSLSSPQTVTYDYVVSNTGNITLTGIGLVDDNAGAVTCPATSLAVGASMTCHATHSFTQAELDANGSPTAGSGLLHNGVTAHSNEAPDAHGSLNIPIVQNAELTVKKSSVTSSLSGPQTVTYDYLVSNTGNVTLTGINLADNNAGAVTCPATSLAVGTSMTCHATHAFTQAEMDANGSPTTDSGNLTNTVTATSNQTPPESDTLAIPIAQQPKVVLTKVGVLDTTVVPPDDRADAGDKIDYTLTATNTGNVTLQNVTISDPSLTLTCTPPQPTTLALGAQLVCKGSHTLSQSEVNNGSVTNTATVTGETPTGKPVDDTASATVELPPAAALSLTKTAAESAFHLVGDVLHYTYVVTNTGNLRLAAPITVTDDKTTATCVAMTTVGNKDAFLNPGESVTCSATYTVTAADVAAGKVTNVATASAEEIVSNEATTTVPFEKLSSTTASDIHNAQHQVVTAVAAGTVVHDFVTVTGRAAAPVPSGSVTVDWFTNGTCTGSPAATSAGVALDANGHAEAAALTQGPLAAGMYAFRAHYAGDPTYTASDGPCEPLRVVDATIQIGPSATNPVGAAHTFTAHVNVNNGSGFANAPDGTSIGFTIASGPGNFTTASPCVTSGGTGSCSITLVSNVTGATVVSAQATVSVSGVSLTRQTNGTGGSSGPATKLWAAAAARTDVVNSSGAVVTTVTAGAVVHDQVFVSKAPGTPDAVPPPSGTVVFHRYATIDCTGTPTNQSVTLTPGNPSTAVSENFAAVADMSYRADYPGDANYGPVTAACEPLTVTPVPAPAITIVKNPARQTVAFGGTAKFKITVTNTGNTVLTNVVVRDPTATNCKRTSAQIPALASMDPGASVTYTCTKANIKAPFTNVATAVAGAVSGTAVSGADSAVVKVRPFTPKPAPRPKKPTVSHKKPKSTG